MVGHICMVVFCVLSALRKPWTRLGIMPLLWDEVANLVRQSHMGATVEVGYGLRSVIATHVLQMSC